MYIVQWGGEGEEGSRPSGGWTSRLVISWGVAKPQPTNRPFVFFVFPNTLGVEYKDHLVFTLMIKLPLYLHPK